METLSYASVLSYYKQCTDGHQNCTKERQERTRTKRTIEREKRKELRERHSEYDCSVVRNTQICKSVEVCRHSQPIRL